MITFRRITKRFYDKDTLETGGDNMADRTHDAHTQQKHNEIFEQLWLTYFNDTLYAKGLITEEQRNKMRIKIKNRSCVR